MERVRGFRFETGNCWNVHPRAKGSNNRRGWSEIRCRKQIFRGATIIARFSTGPGECEIRGQGQNCWMREARGMELVRQWLKPPKNKRGRSGSSMGDGTRTLREGESVRRTKVKEARVSKEGTPPTPLPGKRALRKNNICT